MEKDTVFIKRIRELANMAYTRGYVTFTPFLNLNELHMVNSLEAGNPGIAVDSFGGYEFAERQIVAFLPDALSYTAGEDGIQNSGGRLLPGEEYPIRCLKIVPTDRKFSAPLSHRDYLGALINLGIERSTLGDILVKSDCAYVFCQEHMAEFIRKNLCRVKHSSVFLEPVEDPEDLPEREYESISKTVASLRLDGILAAAFQASRSSLVQGIESGSVFVNGRMVTSNGYRLKEGDVVSFRGKGKFKFAGVRGESRKGRQIVQIDRYI